MYGTPLARRLIIAKLTTIEPFVRIGDERLMLIIDGWQTKLVLTIKLYHLLHNTFFVLYSTHLLFFYKITVFVLNLQMSKKMTNIVETLSIKTKLWNIY